MTALMTAPAASLADFAAALPKAELHLHIEGSLEPEMMFALARRNGVSLPFASVEDIRRAYNFTRLQDFLDIYYQGADVLRTERDFYDLAYAYAKRAAQDNVRHAEVFFDPQTHTDRGIDFGVVLRGLKAGFQTASADYGLTVGLIMCILRHLDEAAALDTLRAAEPYLDDISAIGLDSSEMGHPPEKFARVFARAASLGLKRVAHAGEEGPPDYVRQALDDLGIDRLDHGNRALEDPILTARLAREAMTLTVCPLSNVKLCVVSSIARHPMRRMLDAGLRATVNSDDPAYFGGYINDNFRALVGSGHIGRRDIVTLVRNSFLGSFLPDKRIAAHLADLDEAVARLDAQDP